MTTFDDIISVIITIAETHPRIPYRKAKSIFDRHWPQHNWIRPLPMHHSTVMLKAAHISGRKIFIH